MGTKRFSLHRPGATQETQNREYVECEVNVENGVADIQIEMLEGFSANMRMGWDGQKLIIVIRDSEGNTENIRIYKQTEQ
jgi:hypothetical protein